MLDCPNCKSTSARKLIGNDKGLYCNECFESFRDNTKKAKDYELSWKVGTVTKGKAWEIDNRMVSKDDKRTVINRITGKPAQY